jgi:hypothetical protein
MANPIGELAQPRPAQNHPHSVVFSPAIAGLR